MNQLWLAGPFATNEGIAYWPAGVADRCARFERLRPDGYQHEQPPQVPVHINHTGPTIGEVVHLEHWRSQLFAVARVDVDKIPGGADTDTDAWYWSAATVSLRSDEVDVTDAVLHELSMTKRPAVWGLRPLESSDRPASTWSSPMMRRAAATDAERRWRYKAPLRIQRLDDEGVAISDHPTFHRTTEPAGLGPRQYSAPIGRILSVR